MNKTEIMNNVTRTLHKTKFQLKKHSPEILIAAGVIGTVAGTVMACKATLKVNDVLEESKENVEKIQEAVEDGVTQAGELYSEEDAKNDLKINTIQTAWKVFKLYAPAVTVEVLSIGAMVGSNVILRKRNATLLAAYTALDTTFKQYRGRVVERFGKDLDRELRYGIKAVEVEETVVNEDGTEETKTVVVNAVNPATISDYAIIYDDGCNGWTKNPEANKFFLKAQERYATERLKRVGHLFLNEVYDMLGAPRTAAGQIVGWIYDEEHPNGDNFVDFGMFDVTDEAKRNFVNGIERNVLLDFNVDGPIVDLI